MTQTTDKRSSKTDGEALSSKTDGEALSSKTDGEALSLYKQDILLWVEETVAKLRAGDFAHLDLENLIEEVESLGISQRRELFSRLNRLLEHLLKRIYVHLPQNYSGWEQTIRHQRVELKKLLQTAPSLKSQWDENVEEAWESSLQNIRKEYRKIEFPDHWPHDRSIEFLLNEDLWIAEDQD